MPYYRTESITLRRRALRDADAMLTLYTRDHGKISAIVRGALKTGSRFAGVTQPFNRLDTVFYARLEDQEVWTLTQASLVRQFPRIQGDYLRMAAASSIGEWVDLLSGDAERNETVWDALWNALERFEANAPPWETLLYYQWALLRTAGVRPGTGACARCGRQEDSAWYCHVKEGTLYCSDCESRGRRLSGGALQAARRFSLPDGPPNVRLAPSQRLELLDWFHNHLTYHAQANLKTHTALRALATIAQPAKNTREMAVE